MIPNISRKNGKSFRGAARYYFHDKPTEGDKKPRTSERVAWTATRNTCNIDPELAIDEMWKTAFDRDYLKMVSGELLTGRKMTNPVKTVSLSWAPHQEPTREQMQEAADDFLRHMGWQEHEAVYVAHDDTPHAHVHIILNRVHPENGRTLNDWQERKRAQVWALGYEREHGQVLCHGREGRYEPDRDGQVAAQAMGPDLRPDGIPHPYAKLFQESERAFKKAEAAHAVEDQLEKEILSEDHRREREEHLVSASQEFRDVRNAVWREVRAEFKPAWREHFNEAEKLREVFAADADRINDAAARAFACRNYNEGFALWQELYARERIVEREITEAARSLRDEQKSVTKQRQDEACKELIEERNERFDAIKARQKEERQQLKDWQVERDDFGQDPEKAHSTSSDPRSPVPSQAADVVDLLQSEPDPAARPDPPREPDPVPFAMEDIEHEADDPALKLDSDERSVEREPDLTLEIPSLAQDPETRPSRGLADAGAGAIGKLAEIIADIIGDIVSPPTPQELAKAKRDAERVEVKRPEREAAAFEAELARLAKQAAASLAEEQREDKKRGERYWEERERSRER